MKQVQQRINTICQKWMRGFQSKRLIYFALATIGILGLIIQLISTRWGVGLSPDSATYIAGARSIVDGQGFGFPDGDGVSIPITLWPPMFSFILAIPELVKIDPVMSARWINAFFLAGTTILIGLMVYRSTNGSKISSILASLLVIFTYDVIFVHSWAWSEPAFIFLGFLGLYFLDNYLRHGRTVPLIISAILIALATLTRYPGLAFLGAVAVALLFIDQRDQFPSRIFRAVKFSVLVSIPFLTWLIRNIIVGGTIASRPIGYQPIRLDEIFSAVQIMSLWVIPGRISNSIRRPLLGVFLIGVLILLLATLVQDRKKGSGEKKYTTSLPWMILLFLFIYTILVLFAKIYLLPKFPLDDVRYFLPIYISLLYLSMTGFYRLYHFLKVAVAKHPARKTSNYLITTFGIGLVLMGLAILLFHSVHTLRWVEWAHRKGLGYGSKSWHETELLNFIESLPSDATIYSNGYDAINVLTGRPVYSIPKGENASPERTEEDVITDIKIMSRNLLAKDSYFVYFNSITWRRLVDDAFINELISLEPVFDTHEGTIYRYPR